MGWDTLTKTGPNKRTSGTPMVSTSTRVSSRGKVTTTIYMADTFSSQYGEGEANKLRSVRVELGNGEHEDHLRVVSDPKGEFACSPLAKGGMRLTLHTFRGSPLHRSGTIACRILDKDANSFVVALPVDDWAQEAEQIRRAAQNTEARAKGSQGPTTAEAPRKVQGGYRPDTSTPLGGPPSAGSAVMAPKPVSAPSLPSTAVKSASTASDDGKLNPLTYLRRKGLEISRVRNGSGSDAASSYFVQGKGLVTRKQVLSQINIYRKSADMGPLNEGDVDWEATDSSDN